MKSKALIISVDLKNRAGRLSGSIEELARLAQTAGINVDSSLEIKVTKYNPAIFIGTGKVSEIAAKIRECGINTVIFDEDLSPAQQRNLGGEIPARIIDRTRLILDIFAQRAKTREGKLQVELADLTYMLPRLTGKGLAMSQQKGKIGTRGPGERQLEYDRRNIRGRIIHLKKEIEQIKNERFVRNKKRNNVPVPQIAIVGYTNAGKSTLLNCLTGGKAGAYVDDKLFATLDTATRRVKLPSGGCALFTDTVGFIQKLPHTLIAAFRATLEQIADADCILHVHDCSSKSMHRQAEAVEKTLKELKAETIPRLNIYNKADLLPEGEHILSSDGNYTLISALRQTGINEMLKLVENVLAVRWKYCEILAPHHKWKLLNEIHKTCMVLSSKHCGEGTKIAFKATAENWQRIQKELAA